MDDTAGRLAASVVELEEQRARVLQTTRLKNDLIATLAHDIKGPLTSIIGFAELLEEGYLEGDAAADAAKTIRKNAQRLAALANDVLSLSRVERGELEIDDRAVDLVEILRAAIEAIRAEREVRFEPGSSPAVVRGDGDRLRQVFDAVLRNAISYSSPESPIVVEMSGNREEWAIAITDRGIGVPPEDIPRLFQRFGRASNAKRAKIAGSGVGLFVARSIVERHGGTIGVSSVLGAGSTFTVTLPSIDSERSQRPMRVTMLSADEPLRRFVAYELRTQGYRVRECQTLDDLTVSGDLRAGDVVLADDRAASADDVRKILPGDRTVRAVGLVESSADGWEHVLRRPFLTTELMVAIECAGADQ